MLSQFKTGGTQLTLNQLVTLLMRVCNLLGKTAIKINGILYTSIEKELIILFPKTFRLKTYSTPNVSYMEFKFSH